jgi:hypothetical protein
MLIKPIYDAYLKRWLETSHEESETLFSPSQFLTLPYQLRLFLAGAKIKIKTDFGDSHVLGNYKKGFVYDVSEVELKDYRMYSSVYNNGRRNCLSWDDVHLIGEMCPDSFIHNEDFFMLFPTEYEIVLDEKA